MIANDEYIFSVQEKSFIAFSLGPEPPVVVIKEGAECDGLYELKDSYCTNSSCDCRYGVLTARRQKREKIVLNVGWEKPSHYIKRGFPPEKAKLLRYGCLESQKKNQPAYAQEFLSYFRKLMEEDPRLTDYMRNHYECAKIYGSSWNDPEARE